MKRAIPFLVLFCACAPTISNAAWGPDGNAVVVAPAAQDRFVAIPFGSGGILVAWVDQRSGDPGDIYAMALDAVGDPAAGWPVGGVPICTAPGEQSFLSMIPDGAGGAYLRWIDRRTGSPQHALQRITSTGTAAAGWPADGLVFAAGAVDASTYPIASDGGGGAYVVWTEVSPDRARAARFTGSGVVAPGWPADLPMRSASGTEFDMIADGSGGIVALGLGTSVVQATRLAGDASVSAGWPVSGLLPWGPASRLIAGAAADFFATQVTRVPIFCPCCDFLYNAVHHVGLDGIADPAWPADGEFGGTAGAILADGAGGILSVGSQPWPCSSMARASARRLEADKSFPWADPNYVCDQILDQQTASIGPDGTGGAFIAWIDFRDHGVPVLYAMRFDAAGHFAAGWPTSGSMEALGAAGPSDPQVVATQAGTAIVVWVDQRSGDADLYAKEMVPGPAGPPVGGVGPERVGFGITWAAANPSRGPIRAIIDLPGSSAGKVEVVDVAGRVRERRTVSPGRTVVTIDAGTGLQPGVYWLKLTQDRNAARHRFVITR